MSNGGSLINLGEISKPATVLIEKIADAIGGVFKPYQIRRVAQPPCHFLRVGPAVEGADAEVAFALRAEAAAGS
jgi:hypothetical protein